MRRVPLVLTVGLVGSMLALPAAQAGAATAPATEVGCSSSALRDAITAANASAGHELLALERGCTYALASPLPVITDALTIRGRDAVIDGAGSVRVLAATSTSSAKLRLVDLTLRNGAASGAGGGLRADGTTTTLDNVSVEGNTATSEPLGSIGGPVSGAGVLQLGGGVTVIDSHIAGNIYVGGGNGAGGGMAIVDATATISRTSIVDNEAEFGGGVFGSDAPLSISSSTLSGNSAPGGGSAVYQVVGRTTAVSSTLDFVTVVDPLASASLVSRGEAAVSAIELRSSIVEAQIGDACSSNDDGTFVDGGSNLLSDGTCGFSAAGDPLLGAITEVDGAHVHVPGDAGAAIGAIAVSSSACNGTASPTDQRGASRVRDGFCDVGAYEVLPRPDTSITGGPDGLISSTDAHFTLVSSLDDATFTCSLDGAPATDCDSAISYEVLSQGDHTLLVNSSRDGVADLSAATRSWTVDTVAPETSITGGPSETVVSSTATFSFASSEPGSTFECSLDGAAFTPCGPAVTYERLRQTAHSFEVRATDLAGNRDATAALRTWAVYYADFSDTFDSEFRPAIQRIKAAGITKGCNPPANTRYCPQDSVTREQMARFLRVALKLPSPSAAERKNFGDDNNSEFESDIEALAFAGITKGCNPPDNTDFCPTDLVTREQLAQFIATGLRLPAPSPAQRKDFVDDNDSEFEAAIEKLAFAGITKGCNPPVNTRFCPEAHVTRGEMAQLLVNAGLA